MFCVAYVIVKTEVQVDKYVHPQDVPNKCVVDYIKSVALISDTIKYETQTVPYMHIFTYLLSSCYLFCNPFTAVIKLCNESFMAGIRHLIFIIQN